MALVTLLPILSGCLSDRAARADIANAAAAKAVAQASTKLPEQPAICRKLFQYPPDAKAGDLARARDEAWFASADSSDRRVIFCADFYDQVKTSYGTPSTASK
ncbi:hypothetical protein GOZ83_19865 [Agrobacterium vitis]|nr:hypothetical protein [Agrobacterium vitis]